MKSLCLAHRISILFLPVLLFVLTFSIVSDGQSRRSKAAPKPSAKKSEKSVKVAKKEVKKDSRSAKKNDSRSAKKSDSRHSSAREKTVAKKGQRHIALNHLDWNIRVVVHAEGVGGRTVVSAVTTR